MAEDIKYCYEAYAQEGVQAFTFQEIDGMETPDPLHHYAFISRPPTRCSPRMSRKRWRSFLRVRCWKRTAISKKRLIGTGPYILKENERKVKMVLTRNPEYFERGFPYVDEYRILSTPDAATRLAAFRTGQSDILGLQSLEDVAALRKTNPQAVVQETATVLTTFGLALRLEKPPFNDVRVRRAMSMAIDRQKQIDTIYGGHAMYRLGHPVFLLRATSIPSAADLGPYWQYRPDRSQTTACRSGLSSGVYHDAVLLRILSADDLADPACTAGFKAQPQH